jgi:predicted metal-dependent hydrolase
VIDKDGKLLIRAPRRTKEDAIREIIQKKERWIITKQQQVAKAGQIHQPVTIADGESLYYLGSPHTIRLTGTDKIEVAGGVIYIPLSFGTDDVAAWLIGKALEILRESVQRYAAVMGLKAAPAFRLSNARTRWGSCSHKNALNFTWRLVLCPQATVDYVVVHELCHIAVKNHSAAFWQKVNAVLPGYQEQRKWLKENRKLMEVL